VPLLAKSCHLYLEVKDIALFIKMDNIICKFCNKSLGTKRSLERHFQVCKKKIEIDNENKIKELENSFEIKEKEYKELLEQKEQSCKQLFQEKLELQNKINILENSLQLTTNFLNEKVNFVKDVSDEKVNLVKEFLPKSIKNNTVNKEDYEDDRGATITNINGNNVYVTQNQIYINKINNLTPINQIIDIIVNDPTLYEKLKTGTKNAINDINQKISGAIYIKNQREHTVCYRIEIENECLTCCDHLNNVIKKVYFNPDVAKKFERMHEAYSIEIGNTGDDTDLLDRINEINIFANFLGMENPSETRFETFYKEHINFFVKNSKKLRDA